MSIESAQAFIERMKTDEEFVQKVMACRNAEQRTGLVKSEGFDFSREEIKILSDELSDDEIAAVSGSGPCWIELVLGCKSVQMGNMLVA